jgi:predicted RNA-binding Zn-ribbon protein involved in translation (DUF1610 family)
MDITPKCLRCGTEMEEGFVPDRAAAVFVPSWVRGQPEKSFWTGTKISTKEQYPIRTFRCPKCGCLESYAGAHHALPAP